jgi:hypothetical protein
MPEQIISASGTQYGMVVNPDGTINIGSMPSISVSANTGSTSYLFGKSGADYYPLLSTSGTAGGKLIVDATISATTGSEAWIKGGSILTYNPIGIGSVIITSARYDLGSFLLIAGSISSMPSVSVSAGSEVYVKGGSISVYNMVAGSIVYMPTISVATGSEQWIKGGSIQTYSPIGIGSIWFGGGIGSVTITNTLASIGSYTSYIGSESWNFGSVFVTGSINIATSLPSIGSFTSMSLGSVAITNIGSVIITNSLSAIGSYSAASAISGTATVAGSVYVTGSINMVEQLSPSVISGNSFLTSGTMTRVYTPGAGSRLILYGYQVTTHTPSNFRILFSGTTANELFRHMMPASGNFAWNLSYTYVIGAANQSLAIGLYEPGSVMFKAILKETV